MLREDGRQLTGAPHSRGRGRVGHRWGTAEGKIGDTRMVATIPPKVKDRIVSNIPLRRLARPEEVARAALFILHDDYYVGTSSPDSGHQR